MRVTASRVYSRPTPVPKMPPGLVELMEGLTKDVLKNNPPDIYGFCADHILKLLEIRDGPSTTKTLSLEHKILKAQEKVKKRAEERWRKYEELQEKPMLGVDGSPNSQSSVVDENIKQVFLKPEHHDHNLTLSSEIEISCGSGNAIDDKDGKTVDVSEVIETEAIVKCESRPLLENDVSTENRTEVPHQEENEERKADIEKSTEFYYAHNAKNEDNPLLEKNVECKVIEQENHSEEKTDDLISEKNVLQVTTADVITSLSETIDKEESNGQNNGGKKIPTITCSHLDDTSHNDSSSDCRIGSVTENVENIITSEVLNSVNSENVNHSEKNYVQAHDVPKILDEKAEKTQLDNVVNLFPDSVDPEVHNHLDEISKGKEVESKNDADVDQINSNVVNLKREIKTKDEEKVELLESNENNSEMMRDLKNGDEIESKANIELTENLNNVDLERVVNEAIENIKRKDSSANDSTTMYVTDNVLKEEESDTSESSNVIDNNIMIVKPNNPEINGKCESVKEAEAKDMNAVGDNSINETDNGSEEVKRAKRDVEVIISEGSNTARNEEAVSADDNKVSNISEKITSEVSGEIASNVNSNAMDLETAAVTIQKVFRTFLFKSRASTFDETVNDENNLSDEDEKKDERHFLPSNMNKERRTLGISRMDTVLQTVNEEKSLSLSTDDSSLSSAATIIQAHVRGFLVRNKLHHGKTASSNSLAISNEPSSTSMDGDPDQNKSKTILNIHIVPEGGNYLSRDESMITSMDLSLDGSPPSSVNLHPHGYNTSERRKQLKREDAVQSVSPPSNNSGKLSEDVDSVKELTINENAYNSLNKDEKNTMAALVKDSSHQETEVGSTETTPTNSLTIETIVGDNKTPNIEMLSSPEPVTESSDKNRRSLTKQSSDEMDVITPFKENISPREATQKLLHSGEFHDAALPTKVSRSDTPVASGE